MNFKVEGIKPLPKTVLDPVRLFPTKEEEQEIVTRKVNEMRAKLKAGRRLSGEEKSFLLKHNPQLYQSAKRVEMQRQALKERLKYAKSKEEANSIISSALSGISEKDPDAEYVIAAITHEAGEFHKSDAYKKLPDTIKESDGKPRMNRYGEANEPDITSLYDRNGKYL